MDWGSALSGIGDWFSKNSGWIKPVVSGVSSYMQSANEANARNQFADLARQQEQNNYNSMMADAAYYDKWMADKQGIDAQNSAMARAASAARARAAAAQAAAMNAAAKQEEQNRLKAARKALGQIQAGYDQSTATLNPFMQQGLNAMPAQARTYQGASDAYANLGATLNNPDFLGRINAPYDISQMPMDQLSRFNPQQAPVSMGNLFAVANGYRKAF
jgi:hypothetical protein